MAARAALVTPARPRARQLRPRHPPPDQRRDVSLALVARGLAVTLLPDLVLPGRHAGIELRPIARDPVSRTIFAVTRATDAARPSTQALVAQVRNLAAALPHTSAARGAGRD